MCKKKKKKKLNKKEQGDKYHFFQDTICVQQWAMSLEYIITDGSINLKEKHQMERTRAAKA